MNYFDTCPSAMASMCVCKEPLGQPRNSKTKWVTIAFFKHCEAWGALWGCPQDSPRPLEARAARGKCKNIPFAHGSCTILGITLRPSPSPRPLKAYRPVHPRVHPTILVITVLDYNQARSVRGELLESGRPCRLQRGGHKD